MVYKVIRPLSLWDVTSAQHWMYSFGNPPTPIILTGVDHFHHRARAYITVFYNTFIHHFSENDAESKCCSALFTHHQPASNSRHCITGAVQLSIRDY